MGRHKSRLALAILGAYACVLLAGPGAAQAEQPVEVTTDGTVFDDLPVPVRDVTDSDASLRTTANEVTVLVSEPGEAPTVTKLRAEDPAAARALAAHLDSEPNVVAAINRPMRALGAVNPEPLAAAQWNLDFIGAPTAWFTTRGAGVTVAVIDTHIDVNNSELVGHILPEIDLLGDALPPTDAHGTSTAALLAGSLDGVGMAGGAPEVSILPIAALDGTGAGDSSTVASAIIAAADAGARVINLSLGGPDQDPVLDRACVYAYTRGAVLVAAGGNSYEEGNAPQFPAASPHVLGVASVDSTGNPSIFSNTGSYISLAAPGEDVLSAGLGGSYEVQSGTSFSAPQVAAAAALVLAANPGLTSAQVVALLTSTAQDDLSANGRDEQLGFGTVRADLAVAAALSTPGSNLAPDAKLRLRALNVSPEPARRGRATPIQVTVQARQLDNVWRPNPAPALVSFEFRPRGSSRYRVISVAASNSDGTASMTVTPTKSGVWRARVLQDDGHWSASNGDKLRVRR